MVASILWTALSQSIFFMVSGTANRSSGELYGTSLILLKKSVTDFPNIAQKVSYSILALGE